MEFFTVQLGFGELFNINAVSLSVNSGDLSLDTLIGTSDDLNFVILSDWEGSDSVLLSEL